MGNGGINTIVVYNIRSMRLIGHYQEIKIQMKIRVKLIKFNTRSKALNYTLIITIFL
jgi:hypothetical protein